MMTSRKNVYRSQSIVVWRCSGMESSTSLIPTTQSPIPGSLRSGRKANTERNNTTLNYLTTHRHKQKTMMSGHLVSFYSFFFPPSNTSAALFSNLIYSFCFLQTGRLYDLSRTVNLPLSLYIQYVCVSLYIYIYIYVYNTERDRRARKGRDTLDMFRLLLLLSICALLCGQPLIVVV